MEFEESHKQLLEERIKLYEEKRELQEKIREIDILLEKKEKEIENNCLEYNNSHDWRYEREQGPYGAMCRICVNCGKEI
tara:strand:- start:362 stop:598 length:237 start_codon:yes stop_codon:yes gene_type:complete